jgi:hypothetical protein
MNARDKQEIKDILHQYVGGYIGEQDAKFEVIALSLKQQTDTSNRIETKVSQTNGKVADQEKLIAEIRIQHEREIAQLKLEASKHLLDCPQGVVIKEMDVKFTKLIDRIDSVLLPVKFFANYPWAAWVLIIAVVVSTFLGFYSMVM